MVGLPLSLSGEASAQTERAQAFAAKAQERLGVPVHLYLHVKVDENWAESREMFEEMGLDWVR